MSAAVPPGPTRAPADPAIQTGPLALFAAAIAAGALWVGAADWRLGVQIAGGCASGTMFTLGGGSLRMALTLVAFCGGGFWATFDLAFWNTLPGAGTVVFTQELGWGGALALSLGVLAVLWWALARLARGPQTPLSGGTAGRAASRPRACTAGFGSPPPWSAPGPASICARSSGWPRSAEGRGRFGLILWRKRLKSCAQSRWTPTSPVPGDPIV